MQIACVGVYKFMKLSIILITTSKVNTAINEVNDGSK